MTLLLVSFSVLVGTGKEGRAPGSPGLAEARHLVVLIGDPKHSLPPQNASTFLYLDCVMVPQPHVFEHGPHDPQLLQTQSTVAF